MTLGVSSSQPSPVTQAPINTSSSMPSGLQNAIEVVSQRQADLKNDVAHVLQDASKILSTEVVKETNRTSPSFLGIKALYKAISTVIGKIENFLHVEKGSIEGKIFKTSEYFQGLQSLRQDLGKLNDALRDLGNLTADVQQGKVDVKSAKEQLLSKLKAVETAADDCQCNINYDHANHDDPTEAGIRDSFQSEVVRVVSSISGTAFQEAEALSGQEFANTADLITALGKTDFSEALGKAVSNDNVTLADLNDYTLLEGKAKSTLHQAETLFENVRYASFEDKPPAYESLQLQDLRTAASQLDDEIQSQNLGLYQQRLYNEDRHEHLSLQVNKLNEFIKSVELKIDPAISEEVSQQPKLDEPKLDRVRYGNTHTTSTHKSNVDAREKPSGVNPDFYCEKQQSQYCLKHALNACLGFEAVTVDDLVDQQVAGFINGYKQKSEGAFLQEAAEHLGRSTAELQREFHRDAPKLYRDTAAAEFAIYNGRSPADHIRQHGSEASFGVGIVNAKREELGVPELKSTWLIEPRSEAKLQQNIASLEKIVGETDRLVFGQSAHFVALRKNEQGDWFEVDSLSEGAKRVDPIEYYKTRVARDGSVPILHFPTEVTFSKQDRLAANRIYA
ncbi:hypothetical protein [Pseudovibrio ascidiaceicola]|uniref:hypothetical protein n=1 Tax=Pseudovibrio ascidiaceicola TaxID=285279 RepID=UPI000D6921F8|nr:hypothetical protein [Pseudovibrio ascidiaceicola]